MQPAPANVPRRPLSEEDRQLIIETLRQLEALKRKLKARLDQ